MFNIVHGSCPVFFNVFINYVKDSRTRSAAKSWISCTLGLRTLHAMKRPG